VLAQLSNPDMRTPIAQALGAPERVDCGVIPLDLAQIATLTFEPPDTKRFPCIRLAYEALAGEPAAPIALNAANEVAVDAFLNGRARFTDIARVCEEVLARRADAPIVTLDDALAADAEAREIARGVLHIGNRPAAADSRSSVQARR
jgi:1-deoxy-D-xylulose-5-phosphate reductoisomerase